MAALSTFPTTGSIVRGDPLTIPVIIKVDGVVQDVTSWTWRAQVRATPDRAVITEFTIEVDTPPGETVPCRVLMSLDGDQTTLVKDGNGFDLEQLTPIHLTWWIASFSVVLDYSHAG